MKTFTLFFLFITFAACNGDQVAASSDDHVVSKLSDTILTVYQDKNNCYWFGSRGQGVFKYDGKRLEQFTVRDGLPSNEIWRIVEDQSGNLFFDTQEGIGKYDGKNFSVLTSEEGEWSMGPNDLWFKGTWNKNGVFRYDGNKLYSLKFPENKLAAELQTRFSSMTWSPYGIYSIYQDKKGNVWFGTSNVGIYMYDGSSVNWMYEDHLTNTPSGGSFGIRSIIEDNNGYYWICHTRSKFKIDLDVTRLKRDGMVSYSAETGIEGSKFGSGRDLIYFLGAIEDREHRLWFVTYEEGVWVYDGQSLLQYNVGSGLKLLSIYTDRQGTVWAVTHYDGAYRFTGKAFEKFQP